jgi:hypothetical protein
LRNRSSMYKLMYSGVRCPKLMKYSKAVFRVFWKVLSLANDPEMILRQMTHRQERGKPA